MKQLLWSEWERLWKRKTIWLLFIGIPIILLAAASYLLNQNKVLSTDLPQYTVAWNFSILGLSEMLITVFQGVILIIVIFTVTEEYRTGQLRMVLMRSYSYTEIVFAKYIVSSGAILLFFLIYFIVSHLLGMLLFPTSKEYPLFYHQGLAMPFDGFIYNLTFYGIAFLTAIAIMSVMFLIAVVSRTTTTAIGVGIGFLLFSMSYPMLLSYLYVANVLSKSLYGKLFFTSIPMIQYEGITLMLGENPSFVGWGFSVIAFYILFFSSFVYWFTKKKDYFL